MDNDRDIRSRILYEDNHLIAINKLPGEPSQGDLTGDTPIGDLVKAYIKEVMNKPGDVYLGLLHRIDRPVSGVMLFAKTSKAAERMSKQFHDRLIKKEYLTRVKGIPSPESGHLSHFLLKDKKKNRAKVYFKELKGSKSAELDYQTLKVEDKISLVKVMPITGRSHQIRAQLSFSGWPIEGDVKYGYPTANPDKSISLHAWKLRFLHPTLKTEVEIIAPRKDWM